MPTLILTVGVALQQFLYKQPEVYVDIQIQNLSANNVEVGDSNNLVYGTGVRITPNGTLDLQQWRNDLYFIADGANSDVRIMYQEYGVPQISALLRGDP